MGSMMTKVCTKCGIQKSVDSFSARKDRPGLYKCYCKSCRSADNVVYNRDASEDRRANIRAFIWNYLCDHPCVDCGENDQMVLEFDHLRDKKHGISRMAQNTVSIRAIGLEIAKCEVRCANCHRRKTRQVNTDWMWSMVQYLKDKE